MNRQRPMRLIHKPRIIIMRHSERLDTVLQNNHWPHDVFINGIYSPNVTQMLTVLPLRPDPSEYSWDTPLSRDGRAHAHQLGEYFRSLGLIPHRVYTSPAMRCVQTADAVLDGLGIHAQMPLRLDLALHEETKRELPIQTPEFFASAGYFIDMNYRPSLHPSQSRLIANESRGAYYQRMSHILKRIKNKLISQNMDASVSRYPPTVLVVTHRHCVTLLAELLNIDLTEDRNSHIKRILTQKGNDVRFLSMVIAEYDPSTGIWSFMSEFPRSAFAPQRI